MAPHPSSTSPPDGPGGPAAVTCREVVGALDRFLDGELLPGEVEAVERHLGSCADCSRYLQSYRATIALVRTAFPGPATPLEDGTEAAVPPALRAALFGEPDRWPG